MPCGMLRCALLQVVVTITTPDPGYYATAMLTVQASELWRCGREERQSCKPLAAVEDHLYSRRQVHVRTRVLQAALTILEERGKLPPPGVHTPGFLLRNTTLPERLQLRGIRISIAPGQGGGTGGAAAGTVAAAAKAL